MRSLGRLLALTGLLALAAPTASATPVADSLTHYYATQDTGAILRLYRQAETQEERLLCTYRLFPLTQNPAWLSGLPDAEEARTARELALVAAHWGYRTANAAPWQVPFYGRRSEGALAQARALDPNEPYVLLVEGQSLLYKPGIFGGDAAAAQARFERLREVLRARPAPGLHPMEAEVWIWMALRKQNAPGAESVRQRLLGRRPPPLFRQFLIDPP
ncbi:MAG: hypothetical protein R3181_13260 [Rubricoccaceae bacterium]|nr:hypothetical protein [Rubricoccaceae bacterium]